MAAWVANKWASFEDWVARVQFSGETRIRLYSALCQLLENNVPIRAATAKINAMYGQDKSDPLAVVTKECGQTLDDGEQFSTGLMRWVPFEEYSLIAAGEHSGKLTESLESAIDLIAAKSKISSSLKTATVYPTFLTFTMAVLLYLIAKQMIPNMAMMVNPETWTGASYVLYVVSNMTNDYGQGFTIFSIASLILIIYSLPRLTGKIRIFLDRLPIYSLYRTIQGATFLMNMSVMMNSGIPVLEALEILKKNSSAWMKERIEGACFGVRQGSNLGVALEDAGYNFPDKEAVQYICVLADYAGFEKSISRYSQRWLKSTIDRVEQFAAMTKNVGLILIGCLMSLIVIGSTDMSTSAADAQSTASRHYQK
ncbi:type II secretion system F family protein [Pseudomonas sp. PDM20]|uniref:type II secretion system F family protein n=1 Tax=Pseudomonas sp. PDM20 TaxID=2769254 RepID=UPI001780769D|nr:type II secretion system F family protein [Pseudomonas sp. PDM20]MBD9686844.1 type II secretion system F family protein [Pseudomonas sp. PDM20]